MKKVKTRYRRNLPHILPVGATFFITFRLKNSLPKVVLQRIKEKYDTLISDVYLDDEGFKPERIADLRYNYFLEFDDLLHKVKSGPHWLQNHQVADLLGEKIKKYDGVYYNLIAYCIMSNHVHMIIDTSIQLPKGYSDGDEIDFDYVQVYQILKKIKGASAVEANRILNRTGKFWAKESYDSFIRNKRDLKNKVLYTINNPFFARLVEEWHEWPFTYLNPEWRVS